METLLGLDEQALAVYRRVLRRPDGDPTTWAAEAGLDDEQVRPLLDQLLDRRLLRRAAGSDRLVPVRPDVVVEPVLAEEQRSLAGRHERLAEARQGITDLVELYVAGMAAGRAPVEIERVEGPVALQARITELSATATHELLTIGVSSAIGADHVPEMRAQDRLAWSQGANSRVVLPTSMRDADHLMAYALEASAQGDQYRVMPTPPMTLIVIDRHVGLLPIDQDHLSRGAHVVWSPAIVGAFVTLFELAWDAAEPVFSTQVRRGPREGLTPRDRQLLELMGAGVQDESVARQLGLGLRTVRRDAARLMELLGARTRFQAGVEAARRGWL